LLQQFLGFYARNACTFEHSWFAKHDGWGDQTDLMTQLGF
jgi:hypothetical protein